jgi:3-oxoadipate enol-lactonase
MGAVELHHTIEGPPDGPVLLLGNSLGSSTAMWDPQIAALTARWRVVRFDHRGHGRSPVPAGPYALAELGGDVVALLDRLGLERVAYCGLSLGGMVGMWLGAHAPQRIERLVLCCTSAHMPPAEAWTQRIDTVLEAGTTEPIADAIVSRWLTADFIVAHPDAVARLRAMLVASPAVGYAGCCTAIRDMDQRADLASISAPTLVIAGEQDLATPPPHGRLIADAIPGARLQILSPAAHFANVEQPGAVTDLILEHLEAPA